MTVTTRITRRYLERKTKSELAQMYLELCDENQRMQDWVNDLQSGMYINCVYCGHRYGPDPGTPVAMADERECSRVPRISQRQGCPRCHLLCGQRHPEEDWRTVVTLDRFHSVVLKLGNQLFVRHHHWLNYPREPQLMGIDFRGPQGQKIEITQLEKELKELGFAFNDAFGFWVIERKET